MSSALCDRLAGVGKNTRLNYVRAGGIAALAVAGCWWVTKRYRWDRFLSSSAASSKPAGKPKAAKYDHLSKEERDQWRIQKEEQKKASRERLQAALNGDYSLEIAFDLGYGTSYDDRGGQSLARQLARSYSYIRNSPVQTLVHITSYRGKLPPGATALAKQGSENWYVRRHAEELKEVFKDRLGDVVYLSPDAPDPLPDLQDGKVYVIGGLVDRTILKHMSCREAAEVGVQAYHLPLHHYLGDDKDLLNRGGVLNICSVALILLKYKQSPQWSKVIREAMKEEAPTRFKTLEVEEPPSTPMPS